MSVGRESKMGTLAGGWGRRRGGARRPYLRSDETRAQAGKRHGL